jgi:hypothetical protein
MQFKMCQHFLPLVQQQLNWRQEFEKRLPLFNRNYRKQSQTNIIGEEMYCFQQRSPEQRAFKK